MSQPEFNDNMKWDCPGTVSKAPAESGWGLPSREFGEAGWLSAGLMERLSCEIEEGLERLESVYQGYVTTNSRLGHLRKGRPSQT